MTVFMFEALALLALVLVNRLGFIYVVNRRLHLTFAKNPMLTFLYFLGMALLIILLFPAYAAQLFGGAGIFTVLFFLFVLVVINPWIYRMLKENEHVPRRLAKANPEQQFLLIDEGYLFSKTGDVIFQQVAIGILMLIFLAAGMPFEQLVPLFAVIFGALHFHLFFSAKRVWAAYFTVCAAAAGFMFPFIILLIPGGVYFAIVLHMLWYVGSGALFGLVETDRKA
ncbi:MAG TPA: hypothetical protein VEB18_02405 [Candidatus Paceibacterota bacterium]|nr:hypothetical protein [Candidatus Paceibacterota bacterium]